MAVAAPPEEVLVQTVAELLLELAVEPRAAGPAPEAQAVARQE
jgi:hypothetical protein